MLIPANCLDVHPPTHSPTYQPVHSNQHPFIHCSSIYSSTYPFTIPPSVYLLIHPFTFSNITLSLFAPTRKYIYSHSTCSISFFIHSLPGKDILTEGLERLAQQLRVLVGLSEDFSLVSRIYVLAYNHPQTSYK